MITLIEEKDGWYVNTYPFQLIVDEGVVVYKIGPNTKEKAEKLAESAQHIINGDFS